MFVPYFFSISPSPPHLPSLLSPHFNAAFSNFIHFHSPLRAFVTHVVLKHNPSDRSAMLNAPFNSPHTFWFLTYHIVHIVINSSTLLIYYCSIPILSNKSFTFQSTFLQNTLVFPYRPTSTPFKQRCLQYLPFEFRCIASLSHCPSTFALNLRNQRYPCLPPFRSLFVHACMSFPFHLLNVCPF